MDLGIAFELFSEGTLPSGESQLHLGGFSALPGPVSAVLGFREVRGT